MEPIIEFDRSWQDELIKKIEAGGPWANPVMFDLAFQAEQARIVPSFHGLIAPSQLPDLKLHPHQVETAQHVIEKMHGKAILADEVGLGKTIEAGLIIKEYMIRGLARKVLILVPASLVSQWVSELNRKFAIPAVPQRKSYMWDKCDVIVSSIDTAKRDPHRSLVLKQDYDFVIIDEAHKLKNHKTKNYQFVQLLKKRFCLLLTATPIQNRLSEIFYLVSLLKPGYLGSADVFSRVFKSDRGSLQNEKKLNKLVSQVMVRNRREDTGLRWPKRIVCSLDITFSREEAAFYQSLTDLRHAGIIQGFSLVTLQREACSSREAAFKTLNKIYHASDHLHHEHLWHSIFRRLNAITRNAKAEKALELIREINDKVIIFTEYRATQLYLQWFFKQHGITSVPFSGGFRRGKKDWMRELFKSRIQVLIATEAGGEGINLQFASHLINYDLPWNPMRIEQRIGRIHRLGQEKDVHIYNFAVHGTVESHILNLLYNKIHLFEQVVGRLDAILTRIDLKDIDKQVQTIFEESDSDGEIRIKLDNLSSVINSESQPLSEVRNAAGSH
ncbi:SNF2-related protein [Sporolactobacillus sp. Y61]|uniref:SNF2-related protein n=1 Tax=Sporolactobacillus sp. Y61 TaxID=3160863 RepID=A0AAU8IE06_9BACL|nr:SNF2-related protein [Sporolactobacillus sp. THM19-2]RYL87830.1 DEAD/DEAH box helicase [Sporolactobacillus sp. THM19-2]